jgi:hypothetical protein
MIENLIGALHTQVIMCAETKLRAISDRVKSDRKAAAKHLRKE